MFIPLYAEFFGNSIYSYQEANLDGSFSTYEIHEYERTSEIFSRIQLDQMSTFTSSKRKTDEGLYYC